MARLLASRVFFLLLALGVSSGVTNADPTGYSRWNEYPPGFKAGFVMGVVASLQMVFGEDQHSLALANGISDCAKDVGLSSDLLVEAVDRRYSENLDR